MMLLSPAWLFLLFLIPAVILLHLFRRHRRSEVVPSILIWKLLAKRTPRTLDIRVLRDVNLLLQILAIVVASLLLAEPVLPAAGTTTAGSLVMVLDVSAGMSVEDDGVRRMEAARSAALETVRGTPAGTRIAVVAAGATPRLALSYTDSREAVEEAIRRLEPRAEAGAPAAAITVANGLAGENGEVHFFTDGAFDSQGRLAAESTVVHRIGSPQANVGITRFSARRQGDSWEILISVLNAADETVSGAVELSADGEPVAAPAFTIDAGETRYHVTSVVADEETTVRARLVDVPSSANALASDDEAVAVLDAGAAARVLLVAEESYFFETVLSVLPLVDVTRSETYPISGRYDAVIFDGVSPPPLLAGNYLVFGVRPPDLPAPFGEPREISADVSWDPDHPLFRSVNLAGVEVTQARPIGSTESLEVIARAGEAPLGFTYERGGLRIAGFTFALSESDLPLRVAFPVLVRNALDWLLPELSVGAVRQVPTGEPYAVSLPVGDAVVVESPSGKIDRSVVERNPFVVTDTSEAGIYEIRSTSGTRRFAATLMSRQETDVRPRFVPPADSAERKEAATGTGRPVWRAVLVLLLVCVAADWFVWVRRS